MESIKESINKLAGSSKFMKDYQAMQRSIMNDKHIQNFLKDYPNATPEMIERYLSKAFEYIEGRNNCDRCPGLENCPNLLRGYQPKLYIDKQSLAVTYEPCHLKIKEDLTKKRSELIKSYYVPKEILQATFQSIDKGENSRHLAIKAAFDFVKNYQKGQMNKGIYLYGKFGVGKTYIMGAIMNALAEKGNVESLMVYTPDFFRELKNAISNHTLDEKLDYIKNVQLLILDDIGAETMSPWIRDDILGSILQHRIMDDLPTLFTSNFDFEELEEHLAYSDKSGTDILKAKRIMERIRHYALPISIEGQNRREF